MDDEKRYEFPEIPNDDRSNAMLECIKLLGLRMLSDDVSDISRRTGLYLFFCGDAPRTQPYLYFRMYEELRDTLRDYSDFFNHYIASQGMEYMLETLNREIEPSVKIYFNDFQLAMHPINEIIKKDMRWMPICGLLWGIYGAMYSRKKYNSFIDKVGDTLIKLKNEAMP